LSDAKTPGSEQELGTGGDPKGDKTGTGHEPVAVIGTRKDEISIRFDRRPVLLTRFDPVYPEAARKSHLSGTVVLQAVINTAGRVEDLRVTTSAGELFDAAAVSAVEKWIYRPATLNARAVKVYLTVTVDFALH
jgi:TonB family protein